MMIMTISKKYFDKRTTRNYPKMIEQLCGCIKFNDDEAILCVEAPFHPDWYKPISLLVNFHHEDELI